MISSGEKKALSIIAAVVVVFVVVVATSVFLLTRNSDKEHEPYLHIAVGSDLYTVEPARWCDLFLEKCAPAADQPQRPTPRVPVPVGETILLTVSAEIAESPWRLQTVYWVPGAGIDEDEDKFDAGTTHSVPLRSTPEKILVGITVLPPSGVFIGDNVTYDRGVLTADTSPADFQQIVD
ncbi:DUF2771 family protein [Gordonia paraffinivorans]|uniref:Protein of uncharacterized function (DUF2771) n=1 Tax=Gordonia paraffinivorans TaxID=175628 RepID=A0ABD7V752_9ACTN|nr:DUF2771 family protein [Gordonia paraffinivorans]PWD43223.1 hypothetical protein ACN93_10270 [Gordonia paraffinivorans]VFA89941.1 Protein of uncharacterised function (DUF2771) [Gordonia paraffinivorans]